MGAVVKVEKIPERDLKQAEKLNTDAHKYFGQMQRSWYMFAKTIFEIRETGSYQLLGTETFKDYCMKNYPTIAWPTVVKFLAVVEGWGKAIESKLEKDTDFQLPAYESCYRLVVAEKRLPKEEVSKLRKQVLENKMSYHTLLDRLKEHMDKARDRLRDEVDKSTEAIERQLESDIKREYGSDAEEEEDFMPDQGDDVDDDLVDDDEGEEVVKKGGFDMEVAVSVMRNRVKFLIDNLPVMMKKLNGKTITDEVVELAKELEQVTEVMGAFLDRVEEVTS